jgi:hypothetical protein
VLFEEVQRQRNDVLDPLAQRRQVDRQDAQPVEQVRPKRPLVHARRQIGVGCRHDAHVRLPLHA